jgi:hypothetical protein
VPPRMDERWVRAGIPWMSACVIRLLLHASRLNVFRRPGMLITQRGYLNLLHRLYVVITWWSAEYRRTTSAGFMSRGPAARPFATDPFEVYLGYETREAAKAPSPLSMQQGGLNHEAGGEHLSPTSPWKLRKR